MPLTRLDTTTLAQFCANCGAERELALTDVTYDKDEDAGSESVRMPACPNCRSIELLLPSGLDASAHAREGSYGHLHQLLVDELRERLHPRPVNANERDESKLRKWFPEALALTRPTDFERREEPSAHEKDQHQ